MADILSKKKFEAEVRYIENLPVVHRHAASMAPAMIATIEALAKALEITAGGRSFVGKENVEMVDDLKDKGWLG